MENEPDQLKSHPGVTGECDNIEEPVTITREAEMYAQVVTGQAGVFCRWKMRYRADRCIPCSMFDRCRHAGATDWELTR
jgi:hypothetical protein